MKRIILFLFVAVLTSQIALGQLPRRAFLGVRLVNMNDSLADLSGMKGPGGVYIQEVVSGGTGDKIGIEAGDVILGVNDSAVNNTSDLVSVAGGMQEGDLAAVDIIRKGKRLTLKGTMEPYPVQTSEYGEVIYGAVPFDSGYVRTILYKPHGNGKFPAVFFIQGYGCQSIESLGESAYRKIIDGLLQKGYAVVMTEKACAGDSRNSQPCRDYDLWKEVALFSASYNSLPDYDFIDTANVFIFGHSMGGVQAPLLTTAFSPKAIAVYGTVVRPWFDYFTEQARMQNLIIGGDYLENEQNHETAVRFYYKFMIEKQSPRELAKNEEFKHLLQNSWNCDGSDYMNGRHYTFWQQLQDTKLFEAWSKTPARVYAIWGECDFVAFNLYEHQLIAEIVNKYNPGQAEFIRLPNTGHNFARFGNLEHAVEMSGSYNYQRQNFNPAITELLHECFNKVEHR